MVALALYRADLHSCGHPLSETTAPNAEFQYKVEPPHRCHACTALAIAEREVERPHPSALIWRAERR